MGSRRVAPWIIAAVLCAAGSLGAHAVGYWLEPAGAAAAAGHAWLDLLPALAVGGVVALFASLAVETREILNRRRSSRGARMALPRAAGGGVPRPGARRAALATAQLPLDTLAQPAVLAGLALQLPFGLAALVAARLLSRATVAIASGIGRRTRPHAARGIEWPLPADRRPRRIELLAAGGPRAPGVRRPLRQRTHQGADHVPHDHERARARPRPPGSAAACGSDSSNDTTTGAAARCGVHATPPPRPRRSRRRPPRRRRPRPRRPPRRSPRC